MWNLLVVQSELQVDGEAQADKEETDGEGLP